LLFIGFSSAKGLNSVFLFLSARIELAADILGVSWLMDD
jgi:hypothetical protein